LTDLWLLVKLVDKYINLVFFFLPLLFYFSFLRLLSLFPFLPFPPSPSLSSSSIIVVSTTFNFFSSFIVVVVVAIVATVAYSFSFFSFSSLSYSYPLILTRLHLIYNTYSIKFGGKINTHFNDKLTDDIIYEFKKIHLLTDFKKFNYQWTYRGIFEKFNYWQYGQS